MYVIIGAGPSGLYLAISLINKGISPDELVVYDPRIEAYTRPGHLNVSAFKIAEEGINKKFWSSRKHGHIKDFERALYIQAQNLNIRIEKKRFLALHPSEQNKDSEIILEDISGKREQITAKYLFDCTGSARVVVHRVNELFEEPPFTISSIENLSESYHFLAYVKMSHNDLRIVNKYQPNLEENLENLSSEEYFETFLKLQEFGWNYMYFPRCYGVPFGENKACLYLHAPEALSGEQYYDWVQTVLDCYGQDLKFECLPPSKKYSYKPHFLPFTSGVNKLNEASLTWSTLPDIIPLGDSQIDPDYYLAHGISDGMIRIDEFLSCIKLDQKGGIITFKSNKYQQNINELLDDHIHQRLEEKEKEEKLNINALQIAINKLQRLHLDDKRTIQLTHMLDSVLIQYALAQFEAFQKATIPVILQNDCIV